MNTRIPDVLAGHCALIKMPGIKYVIYDAGSDARLNGDRTIAQVKEYIPAGSTIGGMVLSHTDADPINASWQVLNICEVKKVLLTGFGTGMIGSTTTRTFRRVDSSPQ